jgi:hypothetical protein
MGAQRIRRATLISAAPGTCAVIHKHPTPGGPESREENCIGTVARFYPDPCGIVCAGRNSHRATPASVRAARPTSWGGIRMAARLSPLRRRPLCLDARPLRATAPQGSTLGRPPLGTPPWPICPGRRSLALNAMRQQEKRGTRPAFFCAISTERRRNILSKGRQIAMTKRKPFTNAEGEVRELTARDAAMAKPLSALRHAEQKMLLSLRRLRQPKKTAAR